MISPEGSTSSDFMALWFSQCRIHILICYRISQCYIFTQGVLWPALCYLAACLLLTRGVSSHIQI